MRHKQWVKNKAHFNFRKRHRSLRRPTREPRRSKFAAISRERFIFDQAENASHQQLMVLLVTLAASAAAAAVGAGGRQCGASLCARPGEGRVPNFADIQWQRCVRACLLTRALD